MKLLYCGLKYDYGKRENGFSFEHNNFYNSFISMSKINKVDYLAIDELIENYGKDHLNNELARISKMNNYDLIFFFMFKDEFYKSTLNYIKNDLSIPTVAWMADDHWRFENYSKFWANYFSLIVTTDKNSLSKYFKNGNTNVHLSQWACNHNLYKPNIKQVKYKTTFIGMCYGNRLNNIRILNANEELVKCWGKGWDKGKISLNKMNEIYSNSNINLNFSQSSYQKNIKTFIKIFINKDYNNKFRLNNLDIILANLKNFNSPVKKQIKGRVFEVTGCKGFLLTENCENIQEYFDLNKEISVFDNINEAKEKIKFFDKNPSLTKKIAEEAYIRVINNHTYEKRFLEIFKKLGNV